MRAWLGRYRGEEETAPPPGAINATMGATGEGTRLDDLGTPRFQVSQHQDPALTSTSASPCTNSSKTRITCSRLRVVLKSVLQEPSAF